VSSNNSSRWQIGFNSAFKGLAHDDILFYIVFHSPFMISLTHYLLNSRRVVKQNVNKKELKTD
jgi:hypothetical protein